MHGVFPIRNTGISELIFFMDDQIEFVKSKCERLRIQEPETEAGLFEFGFIYERKMKTFLIFTFLFSAATIFSAELEIPVLYRKTIKKQTPHQLEEVGFLDSGSHYVFAFKIKDLAGFLKAEPCSIAIYTDSDNDLKTGRYPKLFGWDLQIGIQFGKKAYQVVSYDAAGKATRLYSAKCKFFPVNNTLFVLLNKASIPDVKIAPVFAIRTIHGSKTCPEESSLASNTPLDTKKSLGKFADKISIE